MRERGSKMVVNMTDAELLALRSWSRSAGFATLGDFVRFASWRTIAHALTRPKVVNEDAFYFAELEQTTGSGLEQLVRDAANIQNAEDKNAK